MPSGGKHKESEYGSLSPLDCDFHNESTSENPHSPPYHHNLALEHFNPNSSCDVHSEVHENPSEKPLSPTLHHNYAHEHFNTQQRALELEYALDREFDAQHAQDSLPVPESPRPPPLIDGDGEDVIDLTAAGSVPQRPPPLPQPHPPPSSAPVRKGKVAKPDLLHIPCLDHEALGAADFLSASLLAFPAPGKKLDEDTRTRAVAAMSLFNGVVWFERSYYFKMMEVAPPLEEATNWLADIAALDHLRSFGPKTTHGLGSAGSRTAAQKEAAVAFGTRLLAGILPLSMVAFTDGSANPNPGPCGAGAYIYDNVAPGWDTERFAALGPGTNNLGELWAVGLALQAALARIRAHPDHSYQRLYVFTDSQFTRGVLTQGWKSSQHSALARALKQLIRDFPITVIVEWVPAHVGIVHNERADQLADQGTRWSSKHGHNVDVNADFATARYAPAIYDG
jgi:ribonuclease HI